MTRLYLGVGWGHFLVHPLLADVPLTVSRGRLHQRKTQPPRPQGRWSLDSGAFTELSRHGRWTVPQGAFVDQVRRIIKGVGSAPDWVGPRDWMCEPPLLAKTGLSVETHQALTCEDYAGLLERAPEVPWLPVLQGWTPADYTAHRRRYERWGVPLEDAPLVGVGTVCRRQHTPEIASLLGQLGGWGLPLHGFGVKVAGLTAPEAVGALQSADSMAWSYIARMWSYRHGYRSWCGSEKHDDCSSCPTYARSWYDTTTARLTQDQSPRAVPAREAPG